MSLDVRAPDAERLDALVAAVGFEPSYRVEPAQFTGTAPQALRDAIAARGLPLVELALGRRARRGDPRRRPASTPRCSSCGASTAA